MYPTHAIRERVDNLAVNALVQCEEAPCARAFRRLRFWFGLDDQWERSETAQLEAVKLGLGPS